MSSNSGRSWSSTSPIETWEPPVTSAIARLRAEHEAQTVPTDLHFVAVMQERLVGALAVHVRAVQRTDVAQHVSRGRAIEHDVAPRHGDVVEEDLGVGMPADVGVLAVEPERRAGVRARAARRGGRRPAEVPRDTPRARLRRRRPRRRGGSGCSRRGRPRARRRTTSRNGHPADSCDHSGRKPRVQGIRAQPGPQRPLDLNLTVRLSRSRPTLGRRRRRGAPRARSGRPARSPGSNPRRRGHCSRARACRPARR